MHFYNSTTDPCISHCRKTTISVLHDVQLLLTKQQQIWGGIYIHWLFLEQYRYGSLATTTPVIQFAAVPIF